MAFRTFSALARKFSLGKLNMDFKDNTLELVRWWRKDDQDKGAYRQSGREVHESAFQVLEGYNLASDIYFDNAIRLLIAA